MSKVETLSLEERIKVLSVLPRGAKVYIHSASKRRIGYVVNQWSGDKDFKAGIMIQFKTSVYKVPYEDIYPEEVSFAKLIADKLTE